MAKLSPIAALKEGDLQIPEGQITGAMLREALRRLFAELNPYFDGINKLAAKGITAGDNFTADIVTGTFSHGVAQQVALKTLKRAGSALVLSADGQVVFPAASVQMVQSPPASKLGPAASVTVFFGDTSAASVNCTVLLLSEGNQTGTVPVFPAAWNAFPYAANWSDFAGGNMLGGYMKDLAGFVHLRGLNKWSQATNPIPASTLIGTLPAGYRPSASIAFSVANWNGAAFVAGVIDITSGGAVRVQLGANGGANTSGLSLDGITFDTR